MVGDLLNGRTVHSLSYLLSMYPGVKIYFVAPKVVAMKQEIKDFLSSKNVPWEEVGKQTSMSLHFNRSDVLVDDRSGHRFSFGCIYAADLVCC